MLENTDKTQKLSNALKRVFANKQMGFMMAKYPDLVKLSKSQLFTLDKFYEICDKETDNALFKCSFFCVGTSSELENLFLKGIQYKNQPTDKNYQTLLNCLTHLAHLRCEVERRAEYFTCR